LAWEEEKYDAGAVTLIYDTRQFQPTKTKVDKYYVIGKNGSPQTVALAFALAYPTHAEAIEEIARLAMAPEKPVQVAWVDKSIIYSNFLLAWKSARARWRSGK